MDQFPPDREALLKCGFCSKDEIRVAKLVAGKGTNICDGCLKRAAIAVLGVDDTEWKIVSGVIGCGFCERPAGKSWRIVSNAEEPVICDICVELAADIIEEGSGRHIAILRRMSREMDRKPGFFARLFSRQKE